MEGAPSDATNRRRETCQSFPKSLDPFGPIGELRASGKLTTDGSRFNSGNPSRNSAHRLGEALQNVQNSTGDGAVHLPAATPSFSPRRRTHPAHSAKSSLTLGNAGRYVSPPLLIPLF